MAPDLAQLENSLWDAADELRANSGLKASEYGTPVPGLIFVRFADATFAAARHGSRPRPPRVDRVLTQLLARRP